MCNTGVVVCEMPNIVVEMLKIMNFSSVLRNVFNITATEQDIDEFVAIDI